MNLFHHLIEWDQKLTLFLHHLGHPHLDTLMYQLSDPLTWIPLFLLWCYWLIKTQGWQHWFLTLFLLLLCVGVSDFVSSQILKPWIGRLRPCQDPALQSQIQLVNDYCASLYGFVSSHASNSATIFFLFYWLHPRIPLLWVSAFFWMLLFTYTRIYLGVHFLGDLIGGMCLGCIVSLLGLWLSKKASTFLFFNPKTT